MMQKQEFLELCEAAIRAASDKKSGAEVWRCIDSINCLKKAPQTLVVDVLQNSSIGSRFCKVLVEHKNPRIRAEATILRDLWLMYFYTTGRSKCAEIPVKKKMSTTTMMKKSAETPVKKTAGSTMKKKSTISDSSREKLREIIQTSLGKVASEVVSIEMKKRVAVCDPRAVAVSVESAMFERLGCFGGPQKVKYRSILYNMGDSKNPDLRRKVLIGEISGEKLATMDTAEMGSDKMQKELEQIKEKARLREDNRIKFQSHMLMT